MPQGFDLGAEPRFSSLCILAFMATQMRGYFLDKGNSDSGEMVTYLQSRREKCGAATASFCDFDTAPIRKGLDIPPHTVCNQAERPHLYHEVFVGV